MTREQILHNIHTAFDACAKDFYKRSNGVFCNIHSTYGKDSTAEELQYRRARIDFYGFNIVFIYSANSFLNAYPSTLTCYVDFFKSTEDRFIPISFLAGYFKYNSLLPVALPFISDKENMEQAFFCITSALLKLWEDIEDLSTDKAKLNRMLAAYVEEYKLFNINAEVYTDVEEATSDSFFREYQLLRAVSLPFMNIIRGNFKKAEKQINRLKNRGLYENMILELLREGDYYPLPDLSDITTHLKYYDSGGFQKADIKEFAAMTISWFVLSIILSLVYGGLYLLLVGIESAGAELVLGPVANIPFCFTAAFITSIAISYFTRKFFYKLVFRKSYKDFILADAITNTKKSDKLMRGLAAVLGTVSMISMLFFAKWNVKFDENGVTDNSNFLSLAGTYTSYDSIDKVYYKSSRENAYGEIILFPSYVIRFKNGEELDLYRVADDISDYESTLLPLLKEKGVRVENKRLLVGDI